MVALLDRIDTEKISPEMPEDFRDELGDEFEQDEPSSAFAPTPPGAKLTDKLKPPGGLITAGERRRVEAELLLYLELANGACEMACTPCAEFSEQHLKPIAKRAANILARYPDLAYKLIKGGIIADSLALLIAVRPVVKQVVGHHVTHSIVYEGEEAGGVDLSGYGPYRPS